MEPIKVHNGKTVALMNNNIDTDQIIPKVFLKRIEKTGFGAFVFDEWRFLKNGDPNPEFPLNDADRQEATILVTGDNFGCGSSREHAPIAIKAAGVSCVIAETFARIFYRNAINIGLPIIECKEAAAEIQEGETVSINFDTGVITDETTGKTYQGQAFPPFMQGLIDAGGLINYVNSQEA